MKVFLSHIHEEAKLAQVLKEWIESTFAGQVQVFVSSDIKDVPAGSRWLSEIDSALESSVIFLMLCSPTSVSRSWINFEAGCAWIKRVPLMPICHSGIHKGDLPSPISIFQAIEMDSGEFAHDFFESLKIHLKLAKLPRIDVKTFVEELDAARQSIESTSPAIQKMKPSVPVEMSDADALNIIESWMGHRDARLNTQIIRFSDVDSELNLNSGTAERLIEQAAKRWRYVTRRKGEDTILFEEDKSDDGRLRYHDLGF